METVNEVVNYEWGDTLISLEGNESFHCELQTNPNYASYFFTKYYGEKVVVLDESESNVDANPAHYLVNEIEEGLMAYEEPSLNINEKNNCINGNEDHNFSKNINETDGSNLVNLYVNDGCIK